MSLFDERVIRIQSFTSTQIFVSFVSAGHEWLYSTIIRQGTGVEFVGWLGPTDDLVRARRNNSRRSMEVRQREEQVKAEVPEVRPRAK